MDEYVIRDVRTERGWLIHSLFERPIYRVGVEYFNAYILVLSEILV
ncbi:MAG: hypothetical protein KAT07_13645 [Calditrichia bacterium]|nr:hypothetical protein [Calditrichia bacterium]